MAEGSNMICKNVILRAGFFLVAGLLALLLVCGGGSDGDSEEKELAADFPIIVSQGQDALGGEQVAMTSLVGEKPVVLNFWAAECPPCRAELPEFQSFHEEYGDRVLVLGIDLGQFTGQGTPEQAGNSWPSWASRYPQATPRTLRYCPSTRFLACPPRYSSTPTARSIPSGPARSTRKCWSRRPRRCWTGRQIGRIR